MSLPAPPFKVSLPVSPVKISLPDLPVKVSLPARPFNVLCVLSEPSNVLADASPVCVVINVAISFIV